MKNQYTTKNLRDPLSITEEAPENYVHNLLQDATILKNTAHVDFKDENSDNVSFVEVNSMPVVNEHLTAKNNLD